MQASRELVCLGRNKKQVITNRQHLYSVTPRHFQRLPTALLGCSCVELMLHGSLKDSRFSKDGCTWLSLTWVETQASGRGALAALERPSWCSDIAPRSRASAETHRQTSKVTFTQLRVTVNSITVWNYWILLSTWISPSGYALHGSLCCFRKTHFFIWISYIMRKLLFYLLKMCLFLEHKTKTDIVQRKMSRVKNSIKL